jgi:chromosomal replication initiator protein
MDAEHLTEMSGCLVQDVAKAGNSSGSEAPGGAQVRATTGSPSPEESRRLHDAFRECIGAERHAVWFGDASRVDVVRQDSGTVQAIMSIGTGFTHEWLRKTFRADFEAAVRQVCGQSAQVIWQPASEVVAEPPAPPPPPSLPMPEETGAVPVKPRKSTRKSGQTPLATDAQPAARPATPVAFPSNRRSPRLDTFVAGPSNRMAFAAVELAASRPGELSPLILHGPSGVGKTHLLEGICAHFREAHPKAAAVFLSAEQFTTGFLQALHGSGLPGFRRTCRNADLLAIDDLQFFIGKRATITELQQTIDALQRHGRQLVFACDREPEALADLGADMLVRLRGGMTARMLPPDEEVRRGIVASIAARRGLAVPDAVVQFIAAHMTRHTRELAGAVNRLEATSHMLGLPITLAMAEDSLADLVRSSARSIRLADIERAVCSAFGIESGSLQSGQRGRKINHPRMLAMFLARKHTPAALAEIGSYFGRRSHSTVISAQKAVGEWMASRQQIVLADATWDVEEAIRRVEEVLRAG